MNKEKTNLQAETPALSKGDVSGSVIPIYDNTFPNNKTFTEKDMWACWISAKHHFTGDSQPLNFNEWLNKHFR